MERIALDRDSYLWLEFLARGKVPFKKWNDLGRGEPVNNFHLQLAHARLILNYVFEIRDNVSVHYYFFLFLFSLMGATPTTLCQLFLYPTSQNKHPKPIVHYHESSHCKHHCCYPKILLFILFSETRYHPTNLGRLCCETSGTSVNKICSQVYGSDKTP